MDVLLSWAYLELAEQFYADLPDKKARSAAEVAVPELIEYHKRMEKPPERLPDELNNNLLAIRIVVPEENDVSTFRLAKRMPGDVQLPPALAARSYMLSRFPTEWHIAPGKKRQLRFIGLPGLSQFLEYWAVSCAALGQSLPTSLWRDTPVLELPETELLCKLLWACSYNTKGDSQQIFANLHTNWYRPGRSADLDSTVLLALTHRLGVYQRPTDE